LYRQKEKEIIVSQGTYTVRLFWYSDPNLQGFFTDLHIFLCLPAISFFGKRLGVYYRPNLKIPQVSFSSCILVSTWNHFPLRRQESRYLAIMENVQPSTGQLSKNGLLFLRAKVLESLIHGMTRLIQ